ncbi:unnamed protein product [Phytophthora fragariaefolia]|uniref:Unnamed protein product n=1 Tax=Phytophthora fragariaefolia TaxID=1490495 RepID=A0A9W6XTE6_9STRA|nr:unnamed protein product [Phytophthora fragariaefolia]
MSEAAKDILWLQGLCKELVWLHPVPLMFGDNQGAIALSVKPGKHSKTKHIENKNHRVRRKVELKRITVHSGTEDMVADIMTKALGAVKFALFRKLMKVLPVVTVDGEMVTTSTQLLRRSHSVLMRVKMSCTWQGRTGCTCSRGSTTTCIAWWEWERGLHPLRGCTTGHMLLLLMECDHADLANVAVFKWE